MPTLRKKLISALKIIPGIEEKILSEHPDFTSFDYDGKGFAHFDTDFEFDVKLTKRVIASEGLEHPKNSTNHPNRFRSKPHWIVLPLKTNQDVKEIVRLVKEVIAYK